jgi:hypothetical protein
MNPPPVHGVATTLEVAGPFQPVNQISRRCRGDSEPAAELPRTDRLWGEREVCHGVQIGVVHGESAG